MAALLSIHLQLQGKAGKTGKPEKTAKTGAAERGAAVNTLNFAETFVAGQEN